jgi:calcium/calmodulin-dependent protein kinase I
LTIELFRDIKPDNIFFETDKHSVIKVIDFGFSSLYSEEAKGIVGTPMYMAPEIVSKQKYNSKVDIWSLGIMTYIMLNGKVPFESIKREKIMKEIQTYKPDFS